MFSLLLKEIDFIFLFVVSSATVVPCGGPKSSPVHHQQCSLYFTFGPLRSAEVFLEIRKY